MNVESLLHHLAANLDDEIRGQRRLRDHLIFQRSAIDTGSARELERAVRTLGEETEAAGRRAAVRTRVMRAIAQAWSVPASAMTIASIVERAGSRAGRVLAERRTELRAAIEEARREARRTSALARIHGGLFQDVIDTLLGTTGPIEPDRARERRVGGLVDAEA